MKKLKEEEELRQFSRTHYVDHNKIIKDKLEEMEKKNEDYIKIQKIHERIMNYIMIAIIKIIVASRMV